MSQQVHITIHPDVYLGKFQQQLASHLSNLRGTLRGIEDGSLFDKAIAPRPGAVINLDFGPSCVAADDAVTSACNRCFLDVTRSLINYIDRIIAARRCVGTKMKIPAGASSRKEVEEFFENYLEEQYQKVAKDTTLTNPKKVNELVNLKAYERSVLLSYFQLRRCLEHHGAVTTSDITVHYSRFVISASGEEIKSLPYRAPEGTSIDGHFER